MLIRTFSFVAVLCLSSQVNGQDLSDLDDYDVEKFYKKVDLDYGTLDENGNPIRYIFVETELESGKYRIELTDGPGDLYEVKDTDIYIEFRSYFGYAGYGTECLLEVNSYSATVYKLE